MTTSTTSTTTDYYVQASNNDEQPVMVNESPRITSIRRFHLGSARQPMIQLIVSTLPFALLLVWFLWSTWQRPNLDNCYTQADNVDDDETAESYNEICSGYIPLRQYIVVFLVVGQFWLILATYLTWYVPQRHELIEFYIKNGQTIIGDIEYNSNSNSTTTTHQMPLRLTYYGKAIYPLPPTILSTTDSSGDNVDGVINDNRYENHDDDGKGKILIQKHVQIYERYTRERAAIIYLPGRPYSGQPKVDIEIDHDVNLHNKSRLRMVMWYSWCWVLFTLLSPLYILHVLDELEDEYYDPEQYIWKPDRKQNDKYNDRILYYILAFGIIPFIAIIWNGIAWYFYYRWMTESHRKFRRQDDDDGGLLVPVVVAEESSRRRRRGGAGGGTGCCCNLCFDDEDCETIEMSSSGYQNMQQQQQQSEPTTANKMDTNTTTTDPSNTTTTTTPATSAPPTIT